MRNGNFEAEQFEEETWDDVFDDERLSRQADITVIGFGLET